MIYKIEELQLWIEARALFKDIIPYLSIAKGSAGEFKSQLYRCYDLNFLSQKNAELYIAKTDNIINNLGGFIKYLNNAEKKGIKFKKNIN